MDHPLTGHLSGAIILLAAAVVAAAANRAAGRDATVSVTPGASAFGDIAQFIGGPVADSAVRSFPLDMARDPLIGDADVNSTVASGSNAPTVSPTAERKLTAVLIADERRVAVIDDAAVSVGDVLRDGSRVSAIQPNGVWLIDRSGRWRMLTLSRTGGR